MRRSTQSMRSWTRAIERIDDLMKGGTRPNKYVATLDVGTSSIKAMLYDMHARPVPGIGVRHVLPQFIRADGAAELDADRLARIVVRCLAQLLRAAGPQRCGRIAIVGFSTFWHGLLATDDAARTLTPLFSWADSRSWGTIDRLRDRVDSEEVRLRTGCPIHPSYWPAKLAWLREERPDLWKRPVRWLSFGDLLHWRMFGVPRTSLSMASGTGMFRLLDCRWDDELLSELKIQPESLPEIGAIGQGLTPAFRRLLPALADVPWMHAVGDGALANLGSGCTSPAKRALTVGTSGALRVMHASSSLGLPPGLWRYRLDRDRLVTGGAISNGGNLRDWLLRVLRLDERKFEERMRRMAPAANGLTFLPHLAGERSLGYAPHAQAAVAGLTAATTPEDVARAGLEAVAIEFARVNWRLDRVFRKAAPLVASGSALLNSPAWMQMVADATGRSVEIGKAREASSRGAALFAIELLGLGKQPKFAPSDGRVFKPRPSITRAYRALAARQRALYKALTEDQILVTASRLSKIEDSLE